jgi:hypothetical protein
MIDSRAIRFFQNLSRLNNSDNDFFTAVSDIPLDQVHEMYTLAKTVKVTPRIQKKYTWYRNDATGNLNQKDLFNIDGIPVHEHYGKVFKNEQLPENLESGTYIYTKEYNSNAVKIEWLPEYEPFKNALKILDKEWRWVQLIKIDPMAWWSPKNNHPTDAIKDQYKLYWIPLNYVKNRLVGAVDVGYFEPKLGKIYTLDGIKYQYSTINIGLEPMYNLMGLVI